MKKIVYCMYDKITDIFDSVYLFNTPEEAYASYRRTFRDLYIRGEITQDQLKDIQFVGFAEFDSKTAEFVNRPRDEWNVITPLLLIADVVKENVENEISY